MRLMINGKPYEVPASTLAEAVECFFEDEPRFQAQGARVIATALNGAFVPARRRGETPLSPEDRIEILAPMQGG